MTRRPAGLLHRPGALARQLVPSLAALGVLLMLRQSGLSERLNLFAYDLALQLRPAPSGANTPVRIIGIDEEDLARYGPQIPDAMLAETVERLDRLGVRAIGLDMFCGQAIGFGWQRLRRQAVANPRLVSITFDLDGKRAIPGTPPHRQAYADIYTDPQDGVVRRDLLHVTGQRAVNQVSLPMRLLQIATGQDQLLRRLERQPHALATLDVGAGGYRPEAGVSAPGYLQRMLPYHQPGSFPTWSLRAFLRGSPPKEHSLLFRDSIVLIGVVAPSSKDTFPVPFSPWRQGERRYALPGVEIHAHRLAGLLALNAGQRPGIEAAPRAVNRLLLLVGIAAGWAVGEGMSSLRRSVAAGIAGALVGLGATAGSLALGMWWDGALPLMAYALMAAAAWTRRGSGHQERGFALERQNKQVRTLFDRFVSRNVAEALLAKANGQDSPVEPASQQLQNITVLMSDLRGFSLLSKDHHPATIVRLLNRYFEVMFEVIEAHGGTIDEVLGDAILVFFGAPLPRIDHGEAAIACALAMQLAMEHVNESNRQQGLPALEMGIGLCSGEVLAGTIGSQRRAKYGVVGAAVNLAARIEALTIGGEVLAAESTVRAARTELRIDADYRLEVKGSLEPLRIVSIGAIAGRHNLALANRVPQRQALPKPVPIRYSILKGKHRQGLPYPATITHLAERHAWIVPEEDNLEPFLDLVLNVPGLSGDAYGKVRGQACGSAQIIFTVLPPDIQEWFRSLVIPGPEGT
ncbi:MAG: adenylate/guanylate cyclase domain-containing protein [Cyanobacteriota bacterium]|nr:adenylate/guanylate cyclase domain-containing protein [Cyanobacteriota bacterium]